MQDEIEQGQKRLGRFFLVFNLSWMVVSIVSLTYSAMGTFVIHPEYLQQWKGPAIFLLMLLVLTLLSITVLPFFKKIRGITWPPTLSFSLSYWIVMFSTVTILNIFDMNFVWAYFVVLGLTFGLFEKVPAAILATLNFLAYCWFQGLLTWPITTDHLDAMFGIVITFGSITLMCITIQRLIGERYKREALLNQLKDSNRELEEAHRQLAESAAQEQELAVLRERTRLAREMHDTLGHALVLVSVKLEAAQRLREIDPPRCAQELEMTTEIVRSSMKELRASIANLRSPALEREPACRVLSRYAREMAQRCNLRVTYDLYPDIEGLPETVEDTLWRVGQEALTNIEKHAQAQNVLLHISRQDGQIFLKIEDDGVGLLDLSGEYEPANKTGYQSPSGHYGLSGMTERVKNARGHLSIHPGANQQGTTIEVTLPLVEMPILLVSSERVAQELASRPGTQTRQTA